MSRIGIGIHGGTHVACAVYFNHIHRVANWQRWALENGHSLALQGVAHATVAQARGKICRELIGMGCDYWLSLDTDHIVPEELLPKLLAQLHADEALAIISGLITKRMFPYETVAFRFAPGTKFFLGVDITHSTGVHKVDGCAFGCTLVDLKALAALPRP